jgi:hypothetical protein
MRKAWQAGGVESEEGVVVESCPQMPCPASPASPIAASRRKRLREVQGMLRGGLRNTLDFGSAIPG